jgi:hypothetical protein
MRSTSVGLSAAVAVVFSFGCSPSAGDGANGGSASSGGVTSSAGGSASSGGAGGSAGGAAGAALGTGGGFITSSSPDGGPAQSGSGGACGELVLEPEAAVETKTIQVAINCTSDSPEPIALYIVLDNSGSMKDNDKWTDAVAALTQFVQSDPTAVGAPWTCVDKDGKSVTPPSNLPAPGSGAISVAIQYFHPENTGQNPDECNGQAHATPAVPMGPIPANGGAIVGSLGNTKPNGDTPTVGALTGGTQYCSAFQDANPGKKCVVVLVTDGQPNGCGLSSSCGRNNGGNDCVDPNSASVLTPIASGPFQSKAVLTFTLGMNGVNAAGFDLLNAIAIAGGSDCTPGVPGKEACDITASGSQGFLAALNTIRKSVQLTSAQTKDVTTTTTQTSTLPCQWVIPPPPDGKTIQKDHVNVSFTTGGATQLLANVPTGAECDAAGGGWYYDDATTPTRILSCPQTCTAIQSVTDASVHVLVGCATQVASVR